MSVRPPRNPRYKSQLVALNQQLLAFACVLAMAIAAAGVVRLDVVPSAPDASALAPAIEQGDAYVATKPVAPKVREVSAVVPAAKPAPVTKDGLRLLDTSAPEKVSGYATVGVTWDESDPVAEDRVRFEVRSLKAGRWSAWEAFEYHDDHGPDRGEGDGGRTLRQGTEPSVVGEVDQVQFRVFGTVPHGMRWVLIDPGQDKVVKQAPRIDTGKLAGTKAAEADGSRALSRSGISLAAKKAMRVAPKPQIYTRAQWGADEKLRDQSPPSYGTIKAGFVHHTVNANDYSAAQVPALLRSIYAYHVVSRGWRDIGYNFLVDRFGKIWEGRWGGVDRAVVGAHTLGYNEVAFAMSAIGNFDVAQPPQAVVTAYAKLMAWKLSMYGIDAGATRVYVKDRYLAAINGHRDVGSTACPGRYLYAKLGEIRAAAAKIQQTGESPGDPTPTPTPPPPPTSTMPVPAADLPPRTSVAGSRWPDLIVRVKGSQELKVVPTGGRLSFTGPVRSAGSWAGADQVVAAGDLTGDGKGDLLVRNGTNKRSSVRAGDGKGSFGTPGPTTSAFAKYRWLTAARDLDGDGHPDVVAGDGKALYLVRGLGRGTFAPATVLLRTWTGGRVVGAGDLDGDGHKDLVTLDAQRRLVLLPGRTGGLGAARPIGPAPEGATALLGGGDLTGDGVPDLVLKDDAGNALVLPGDGKGGVTRALDPFAVLEGAKRVGFGPILGSASARTSFALTGITDSGLEVTGTNGQGTVGAPLGGTSKILDAKSLLSVGDWDGDGHGDVVQRTADGDTLYLRLGDGNGGFGGRLLLAQGFAKVTALSAVGDVNGDGHPDLVGRAGTTSALSIYPGDGAKGLGKPIKPTPGLRSYNQLGSGTWSSTAPGYRVGASDGSFVPTVDPKGARALGDTYDWVIGHGDADGDGKADLIVREKATGDLYLLPGTDAGWGEPVFLAAGFGQYDLGG